MCPPSTVLHAYCQKLERRRNGVVQGSTSEKLADMPSRSHPIQFFLVALAGSFNQQQRDIIDSLQEENGVLRANGSEPDICASPMTSAVDSPRVPEHSGDGSCA